MSSVWRLMEHQKQPHTWGPNNLFVEKSWNVIHPWGFKGLGLLFCPLGFMCTRSTFRPDTYQASEVNKWYPFTCSTHKHTTERKCHAQWWHTHTHTHPIVVVVKKSRILCNKKSFWQIRLTHKKTTLTHYKMNWSMEHWTRDEFFGAYK